MKKILIIYKCPQSQHPEKIAHELKEEGYAVSQVDLESIDSDMAALSRFDLAILHAHPENLAWETYLDLRHRFSKTPTLFYTRHYAFNSLKSAIRNVFAQKARIAQEKEEMRPGHVFNGQGLHAR